MFDVVHNKSFIFLHAPKTGGGSMKLALAQGRPETINKIPASCFRLINGTGAWIREKYKYPRQDFVLSIYHKNLFFYKNKLFTEKCFNNALKFTMVRNPYERLFSLYKWKSARFNEVKVNNGGYSEKSVKMSLSSLGKSASLIGDRVSFREFVLNHNLYLNEAEKSNVLDFVGLEFDRVIRFESIEEDSKIILDELGISEGIPHVHNTPKTDDWRSYYDEDTIQVASMIYSKDIDFFGYSF